MHRKVPGFPKADLNDIASVEALINDKTVAVMLEPIQGEGGVIRRRASSCRRCAHSRASTACC